MNEKMARNGAVGVFDTPAVRPADTSTATVPQYPRTGQCIQGPVSAVRSGELC